MFILGKGSERRANIDPDTDFAEQYTWQTKGSYIRYVRWEAYVGRICC